MIKNITKILLSPWANLGVAIIVGAVGVWAMFFAGLRVSPAVDFVLCGINLGFFMQRRITDNILDSYKQLLKDLENVLATNELPLRKTEQGYVSPFQIK